MSKNESNYYPFIAVMHQTFNYCGIVAHLRLVKFGKVALHELEKMKGRIVPILKTPSIQPLRRPCIWRSVLIK